MADDAIKTVSRRKFASTSALAALSAAIVPSRVLGADAPSNKLNIAAVGVGGMGAANLKACEGESIVALCDVDSAYAAKTIARYPKAKLYKDYRVMLDQEKGIDAVVIATPDHTHAVITMAAMQAGKHVFCQKPLTHTLQEARKVTEAARAVQDPDPDGQPGALLRSDPAAQGVVGRRRHRQRDRGPRLDRSARGRRPVVDVFRPGQAQATHHPCPRRSTGTCGWGRSRTAPITPTTIPLKWRAWLDFGTGALGDMGCHIIDPAFWALELGAPKTIEATSTHWEPAVASQTFPARIHRSLRVPGPRQSGRR